MVQVIYKDSALSHSQVSRWLKLVKNIGNGGRMSRALDGRQSAKLTKIYLVLVIFKISIVETVFRMITEILSTSKITVRDVVRDNLHMQKVCVILIPKLLTVCKTDLISWTMWTSDETEALGCDQDTQRQSSEWYTSRSLRPKKTIISKLNLKIMFIVFFNVKSMVHIEFVPQGQTVNSTYYGEVLNRWRKKGCSFSKGYRRYMTARSRQRFQSHRSARPGIPGQTHLGNVAPAPLWFLALANFSFPKISTGLKVNRFWNHRDQSNLHDKGSERSPVDVF